VLAGNSLAGELVLDLVLERWPLDDVLVIAPLDTSKHGWQPSLGEAARARGCTLLQPERVNEASVLERVADHRPDLLLSVYYTQIFRPAFLALFDGPAVNFHPSLLPRHRGTAPLIWAMVEGDAEVGVTVHELTPGVDDGPIVAQQRLRVADDDTGYSLQLKIAHVARDLAASLLDRLIAGQGLGPTRPQAGAGSHHRKRDPSVNHIDWAQPRVRVRNIVRALAPPLPGAYTIVGGKTLVLEAVGLGPETLGRPGAIEVRAGAVLIWAADGALTIERATIDGTTYDRAALAAALGAADGEFAS
jgi:methionyl-tRNA formyltransferase